jgi:hypothetical protein
MMGLEEAAVSMEPHPSLLLPWSHKLQECTADSVHVYSYEGWKRYPGSTGVQDAMLDFGTEDKDYMSSIVTGARIQDGKQVIKRAPSLPVLEAL